MPPRKQTQGTHNVTTATTEPTQLYTGDTWAWQRNLADYPASAGWVLKYTFINAAARFAIAASADGDRHAVSVAATTTDGYTAGDYTWQAYVELGADRYTVGTGKTKVLAGLSSGTAPADMRSQAQIALDAATASLATYTATNGRVSEYEIAGRKMKFRSLAELRQLVNYWAHEVQKEVDAERIRKGLGTSRKIYTRFGS